ncbi:protein MICRORCHIDIA 7-like protein [Cinnamomum micranthum f. kanehirae]|uniref:Protein MICRORCHIDIA 7-like protein n=1 Tax=Cinnamomum micranthum f. kanehirae TaxID=337451 RepID=A0A3S4P8D8_9MAGN|nr:protein MICRORCHIDIA 7-like protein [Cinnamomum micranthum f. kanehirae]
MESVSVKEETLELEAPKSQFPKPRLDALKPDPANVIDLSSSSSGSGRDSDSDDDDVLDSTRKRSMVSDNGKGGPPSKKPKPVDYVLPAGFLDPLPPDEILPEPEQELALVSFSPPRPKGGDQSFKQFWKAGDYVGNPTKDFSSTAVGMDHLRVHPKFLHSNATSHKWVLGAFAELLDNSLDEVCNGATYCNIDMLENKKDRRRMLLIEDNGGGMDPDKMRQCMSLGYSVKSNQANTIGQYGNGFKTSTMRLGADVIVFSRCCGKDGKSPTQSIGLLSYTFLRSTRKEDIVVPMLDYERNGTAWNKMMRSQEADWNRNVETIVEWSPYSSEADLLLQFNSMKEQGTRIIIYNLWEDDQGELELDFSADRHDIQIRGVNRDEKKIQMAKQFPNSRHFLTYRHSLRSYASILYLRFPLGFRIVLRGKDVMHHNIVNDMMLIQEVTYRPQTGSDGVPKDSNMVAVVTMGFVKDAKDHIDVQGFNVYHKNRLIKPFWRLWNAAGSDGRGVIGVLEANFVEPAHDKQGFERTTVLSRLEAKLVQMQKTYWSTNCHYIGYAPRRNKKLANASSSREDSPEVIPQSSSRHSRQSKITGSLTEGKAGSTRHANVHVSSGRENGKAASKFGKKASNPHSRLRERSTPSGEESDDEVLRPHERLENEYDIDKASPAQKSSQRNSSHRSQLSYSDDSEPEHHSSKAGTKRVSTRARSKAADGACNGDGLDQGDSDAHAKKLEEENCELKERLKKLEETMALELQFERDRNKTLEAKLREAERKVEESSKEQEALIDIFSEERTRRDREEENLRKKLKDASTTIRELLEKVASYSKK